MGLVNIQAMLASRFANPGQFETNFLKYLEGEAKIPINTSKSISSGVLADMRPVSGLQTAVFYSGDFVAVRTNMENSYTMPQDEHKMIWGIRVFDAIAAMPQASDWAPGFNIAETKNTNMSIVNNGVNEVTQIFGAEFVPTVFTKETGFHILQQPFVWVGQNNIKLNLDFKVPPVTEDLQVLVELHYYGLVS